MERLIGFIVLCLLLISAPVAFATTATAKQRIDEIAPQIEGINCLKATALLSRFLEIKRLVGDMHARAVKLADAQPDVDFDFGRIQDASNAFEGARALFDAAFSSLTAAIQPFEEQFNRDGRLVYADNESEIEPEAQQIIAALTSLQGSLNDMKSASQNIAQYSFSRETMEIYPVWRDKLDPSSRAHGNVLMFLQPILDDVNEILGDQQLKMVTPLLWLKARDVHFALYDFQVITLIARFYGEDLRSGVEWLNTHLLDQQGDLSEDADNLAIEAETIVANVKEKCRYRVFYRNVKTVDLNTLKRFLENPGVPRVLRPNQ